MRPYVQQNSKFTYLSNLTSVVYISIKFSRIQNLHISQTYIGGLAVTLGLVEFKIYISLKLLGLQGIPQGCLVEFKIYISLKQYLVSLLTLYVQQNSKFTYLSNNACTRPPTSLVQQNSKFTYLSNNFYLMMNKVSVQQNSKFTYLSNSKLKTCHYCQVQQNSKFTYLSNLIIAWSTFKWFSRIQNLHISQTL